MKVDKMYFVNYINKTTILYLLENGNYLLDTTNDDKDKDYFTLRPIKKEDALKMIEESPSGMYGSVLKSKN